MVGQMEKAEQPDVNDVTVNGPAVCSESRSSRRDGKLVSVVIPTFNHAGILTGCLEALLSQDFPLSDFEIIVVDDGSGDDTRDQVLKYAGSTPPVHYAYQKNAGPATARNHGAKLATGEVVLFTDDDCVPAGNWISEMYRPFRNPEDKVVAVKGAYRTRQKSFIAQFAQAEFENRFRKLRRNKYIDFVDTYAAAFRRDVFLSLDGFDASFPEANNEDVEFSYRMSDQGHRMVFNPNAIVYHTHPDTLTRYLKQKFGRAYWRMAVYRSFPSKMGSDTYTPQTLKLQILLVFMMIPCLLGSPFLPLLRYALAGTALAFLASVVPFVAGVLGLAVIPPKPPREEPVDEEQGVENEAADAADAAPPRGRIMGSVVEKVVGFLASLTRNVVSLPFVKATARCVAHAAIFIVHGVLFRGTCFLVKAAVVALHGIEKLLVSIAKCCRAAWRSPPMNILRSGANWVATRKPLMALLSIPVLALRGVVMGTGILWGIQGHRTNRQGRFSHVCMLLLSDLGALSISGVVGVWVRRHLLMGILGEHLVPLSVYLPLILPCALIMVAMFFLAGLYRPYKGLSQVNEFVLLCKVMVTVGVAAIAVLHLAELPFSRSAVLVSVLCSLLSVSVFRGITRALLRAYENGGKGQGRSRVIVAGTGEAARLVCRKLRAADALGSVVVGFVHAEEGHEGEVLDGCKVLGALNNLSDLIEQYRIHEVFVCLPMLPEEDTMDIIDTHSVPGVHFHMISNLFDLVSAELDIAESNSIPITYLSNENVKVVYLVVKRLFDIAFSGMVILLTLPAWILIMIAIKMETEGPAIFSQERVGKDGKLFRVYKFRTMFSDTPKFEVAPTAPGDARITRVGEFLRKTSLDEFPQFLNVLQGDMSVVGPRPEMPFMAKQYKPWQRKRLTVKPGITGLWQIMGRKDLPLQESIEYDFYYIKNQSLLLDVTILMRTIPVVLLGRGAY